MLGRLVSTHELLLEGHGELIRRASHSLTCRERHVKCEPGVCLIRAIGQRAKVHMQVTRDGRIARLVDREPRASRDSRRPPRIVANRAECASGVCD